MRSAGKIKRARQFRKAMSDAEVKLWIHLKGHLKDGFVIRRQHPCGPYFLDFYCDRVKLAIEVDGESHSRGDRPERDAERDRWVLGKGVETLRVSGADIMADAGSVAEGIIALIRERIEGLATV